MKKEIIIVLAIAQLLLFVCDFGTQLSYSHKIKGIKQAGIETGEYINTHYPKGNKLAVYFDAGIVPYTTKMRTLDLCGLLNKDIAMNDYENRHKYEDKKKYLTNGQWIEGWKLNINSVFGFKADYFFNFDPDIIVINSKMKNEIQEDAFTKWLTDDSRFERYALVKSFAENDYYYLLYSKNKR